MSPASNKTPPGQRSAPPLDALPNISVNPGISPWHRFQVAALAILVIGYAALSHYSTLSPSAKGLGAALSVGPVLLIGLILIWRWTRPLNALVVAAASCALLYHYWPTVKNTYEWADLVQQSGIYALIAVTFFRSLFAGRVPICTQLAGKVHGTLTPAETEYTRGATVAWVIFYVLMTMAILILFFVVPLRIWSLFVNFAAFGLILLMGIADHAIRRCVLPRHPGGGILKVIQRSLIG